MAGRTTLADALTDPGFTGAGCPRDLAAVVLAVARAARAVPRRLGLDLPDEALDGAHRHALPDPAEVADLVDEEMTRALRASGVVAGALRGDRDLPHTVPGEGPIGRYLVVYDPAAGPLFSVLRAPQPGGGADPADYLRPGTRQVAAGYVAGHGPIELVLTLGAGVRRFVLDPSTGEFVRMARLRATPTCPPPVAGLHRVLAEGGVLQLDGVRLLDQANPIALLVEQAGGRASTGETRVLDVVPRMLGQRTAMVAGEAEGVARLLAPAPTPVPAEIPLFGSRGLFVQPS